MVKQYRITGAEGNKVGLRWLRRINMNLHPVREVSICSALCLQSQQSVADARNLNRKPPGRLTLSTQLKVAVICKQDLLNLNPSKTQNTDYINTHKNRIESVHETRPN